MKPLPIGIQTFEKLRERGFVYIDKTEHVFNLVQRGGFYFLSRPRRFGKSLLLSTIRAVYEGKKAFFKDLWIENKWDWSKTSPVIHLSFASMSYQNNGLEQAILWALSDLAKQYNIVYSRDDVKEQFRELLMHITATQGKVVLLIDEYDKPIIDYLEYDKLPKAKENRAILKSFYSVLKDAGDYLELVFITGVSKFSKVSIFSDLNHLDDLTLNPRYATVCGYTQTELENSFSEYIDAFVEQRHVNREWLIAEIRDWYNGFSWDGQTRVYNPFGTLNFFNNLDFRNFWFATGTPTFLTNLMKEKMEFAFENRTTSANILDKYDIENLDLTALLFQTGYLTIKEKDFFGGEIVLDYPNREVRESSYQFIIDQLSGDKVRDTSTVIVKSLSRAFVSNDLAQVKDIINTLFADLPYELYKRQAENFYHGLLHLLFKYLGIFIESEVNMSRGRADSVVQTATHVYIFEFKYNKSGKEAMNQIKDRGYADKFRLSGKTIIGIGVNFNRRTRNMSGWVEEVLN